MNFNFQLKKYPSQISGTNRETALKSTWKKIVRSEPVAVQKWARMMIFWSFGQRSCCVLVFTKPQGTTRVFSCFEWRNFAIFFSFSGTVLTYLLLQLLIESGVRSKCTLGSIGGTKIIQHWIWKYVDRLILPIWYLTPFLATIGRNCCMSVAQTKKALTMTFSTELVLVNWLVTM